MEGATMPALTPGNFFTEYTNFLATTAHVPLMPAAVNAGTGTLEFAVLGAKRYVPPSFLRLPHHIVPNKLNADLFAVASKADSTRRPEDFPEIKVRDGLPLTTFADQFYALQTDLDSQADPIRQASYSLPQATELAAVYRDSARGQYMTRAGCMMSAGAVQAAFAFGCGGVRDVAWDDVVQGARGASDDFGAAADILWDMRYFHGAAMLYDMAIATEAELMQAARDARLVLDERSTAQWSTSAAFAWKQSIRSDEDPTIFLQRLARGAFDAFRTSPDHELQHFLGERQYRWDLGTRNPAAAAHDSLRMAWTRLDVLHTLLQSDEIAIHHWGYVQNMIGRALKVWITGEILPNEDILEGARAFAEAATRFAG